MRRVTTRLVTSSSPASVVALSTIVHGADGAGAQTTGQPVPFDRLWLLTAGVVALLLLVQVVRVQSLWRRRPTQSAGNEMSSGDVETDE